ncbi:2-isopropylmalate synthase [bioreactor metagenome]|uniref:2-isopropylmalate synthase n=1 Tax=bioreactor metagenome TaxID=1076179 RepID=A0A645HU27_9ZZZZ
MKLIADEIRTSTVCVLARTVKDDIDKAWAAVQGAARPRIHTFIATSPIHMEYKLKMSPEQVLEQAEAMVGYAASLCPEVEFSAEDATRSDVDFLALVFDRVIAAGAKSSTFPTPSAIRHRTSSITSSKPFGRSPVSLTPSGSPCTATMTWDWASPTASLPSAPALPRWNAQ